MKMKIRLVVLRTFSIIFLVCLTISKLVGQNIDSLNLAKKSQHFNFYSTNGVIKVLDSLAITLENNYSRITNHLGIQIDKKINVIFSIFVRCQQLKDKENIIHLS